jgi:hypothetical protein
MFVLIDEDAAWRELLLGVQAVVTQSTDSITIKPGNNALCLVEDLSVRKESNIASKVASL